MRDPTHEYQAGVPLDKLSQYSLFTFGLQFLITLGDAFWWTTNNLKAINSKQYEVEESPVWPFYEFKKDRDFRTQLTRDLRIAFDPIALADYLLGESLTPIYKELNHALYHIINKPIDHIESEEEKRQHEYYTWGSSVNRILESVTLPVSEFVSFVYNEPEVKEDNNNTLRVVDLVDLPNDNPIITIYNNDVTFESEIKLNYNKQTTLPYNNNDSLFNDILSGGNDTLFNDILKGNEDTFNKVLKGNDDIFNKILFQL